MVQTDCKAFKMCRRVLPATGITVTFLQTTPHLTPHQEYCPFQPYRPTVQLTVSTADIRINRIWGYILFERCGPSYRMAKMEITSFHSQGYILLVINRFCACFIG